MTKRIAIIGAGPSGLAQLRAFQAAHARGETMPELVCFEKQSDYGGLWNYTWRTGLDEHGEPIHCSMYRYLWSNGPKECLEFADYSFDEHFKRPIASYPPRAVLWDYIKGRAEKADIRKFIRFQSPVRFVRFHEHTQDFTLTIHDHKLDRVYDERFDYVVVATGHFSVPHVPHFDGLETFNGRVLHAHDFRDALEFKGQDLLMIGTSYSAEDIGSQCHKYGARSITISYRTRPMPFSWPENWHQVPLLSHVHKNIAYFKDETCRKVDAIIFCTGYKHHFPFLPDDLRLKTDNRLWPLALYKGVVFEHNPQLFYLGMQDQYYTFNMFDAQAWFVRDVINGHIALPHGDSMRAHSHAWRVREEKLKTDEEKICFQGDYVKELISHTDYPRFDIDAVNKTFIAWEHHKREDIMGFRDQVYRSLMTGTMAKRHHTPWLLAFDDSLEAYLDENFTSSHEATRHEENIHA